MKAIWFCIGFLSSSSLWRYDTGQMDDIVFPWLTWTTLVFIVVVDAVSFGNDSNR